MLVLGQAEDVLACLFDQFGSSVVESFVCNGVVSGIAGEQVEVLVDEKEIEFI